MSNIIDSVQLSGVTYTLSAQTSGKTVTAGRGISVSTGVTADTVSFNLPISAGTGYNSIIENNEINVATNVCSHAEGYLTKATGNYSHAEGNDSSATTYGSHAEGVGTLAAGNFSHAEGYYTKTLNEGEHASGRHNLSVSASTTFGDSGNTLFSVGNGASTSARHNALEVRQNGDIYISSGGTDILLQDNLGGGGNPTVELTQAEYDALVSAGTVSADTYYIITDASGITATTVVELTQAQYDALTTKDPTTFYVITDAQSVDMSNYYTKTEIDAIIGNIESLLAAI